MQILFYASYGRLLHNADLDTMKRRGKGGISPRSQSVFWPRINALFKTTCFSSLRSLVWHFFPPVLLPPPFSAFVVNGFVSRVHTERQGGVDGATKKGVGRYPAALGSPSGCKRCIVSLLHSFLILRSACVANLQKSPLPLSLSLFL